MSDLHLFALICADARLPHKLDLHFQFRVTGVEHGWNPHKQSMIPVCMNQTEEDLQPLILSGWAALWAERQGSFKKSSCVVSNPFEAANVCHLRHCRSSGCHNSHIELGWRRLLSWWLLPEVSPMKAQDRNDSQTCRVQWPLIGREGDPAAKACVATESGQAVPDQCLLRHLDIAFMPHKSDSNWA